MSDAPHIDWPDDPVVAEVREIRAKLWQEGGGTVTGFLEVVKRQAGAERGVQRADVEQQSGKLGTGAQGASH